MTLTDLLPLLAGHKHVLVTGPQRSGTTIAAEVLAAGLGRPCVREEEVGVARLDLLFERLAGPACVVQAPALAAACHHWPGAVVFLVRDPAEVGASRRRVGWAEHAGAPYLRDDLDGRAAVEFAYHAWRRFQQPALCGRGFGLDYRSLEGHRLWVPDDRRRGFGPRQTREGEA